MIIIIIHKKIKSVKIGHDGEKMASAWELESLTIESANGNETQIISLLILNIETYFKIFFIKQLENKRVVRKGQGYKYKRIKKQRSTNPQIGK